MTADTPVTLREFVQTQFDSHNQLHGQHDSAHMREHESTNLAISKAEAATATALQRAQEVTDERFKGVDERIKNVNDVRTEMRVREQQFVQRTEWDSRGLRIDALEDANIARIAREGERERALTRTMSLIGLAAAISGFVLALVTRLLGLGT